MKKIEIDGKNFWVDYVHVHLGLSDKKCKHRIEPDDILSYVKEAFDYAHSDGQVKVHSRFGVVVNYPVGYTKCIICREPKDNEHITHVPCAEGFSFCSIQDHFNKAKGRKIAFDRAKHIVKLQIQHGVI